MKYLRRYPRAKNLKLRNWHEVTKEESLKYLKPSYANRAEEFLEQSLTLQTPFAIYRKCDYQLAERLLKDETYYQ